MGEDYKVEIIGDLPADESVSLYRQGEFVDLCRGPHVPSTGRLKAVEADRRRRRLLARRRAQRDAAAHLRHRVRRPSEALEEHLARIEEAKKRDHRRLGKELDLFTFDPVAPGSPVLPSQGRLRLQPAGRLRARALREVRLRRGHHAADPGRRAVAPLRPLRELQGEHVLLRSSRSASTRSSR